MEEKNKNTFMYFLGSIGTMIGGTMTFASMIRLIMIPEIFVILESSMGPNTKKIASNAAAPKPTIMKGTTLLKCFLIILISEERLSFVACSLYLTLLNTCRLRYALEVQ
jgi:hypothetical protein